MLPIWPPLGGGINQWPSLKEDYKLVSTQLRDMEQKGHVVQLHIHPQWAFSKFDGKEWRLDTQHYKLSDLTEEEADRVFGNAKIALEDILGHNVTTFRAGGFSAQPTEMLTSLMKKYNIHTDTSVFSHSYYDSPCQKYDYRQMPDKSFYRFEEDICKENIQGAFLEIPITTYLLSPWFNWKLAFTKIFKSDKHKNLGDGISVKTSTQSIKERLTRWSYVLATIDGFKIGYLQKVINKADRCGKEQVTIIGHPKLATRYSIKKFDEFLQVNCQRHTFVTIK